ncbi:MAG TPA: SDR family oxidoreductase [Treponemataceae bacterium]|nr:SDR family oxidoreductase [Treponemataceae bacterium]
MTSGSGEGCGGSAASGISGNSGISGAACGKVALEKKVAIVTGATSGIGKAIADKLTSEGLRVVLNGRSFAGRSGTPPVVLNSADLLDERTPQALLDAALGAFGRLDYVFVNAGTIESAPIETIDIENMCSMIRLKVESSFRLIYTALKHMKKQGSGHVFITSSVMGTKTRENSGAYAAANHALEALAESLRMELSDTDIQITCIEPGLVATNLHRNWPVQPRELLNISTALLPEDIADAVWDVMNKKDYIRIPKLMILPRGHKI